MMRGLILAMTLLLITATAALIGTNIQSEATLELKKNERINDSSSNPKADISEEIVPPRFILNEPIENYLDDQSDIFDPSTSAKAEEESFGNSVSNEESEPITPTEPDQEQIKKTAAPYLKEIFNIKNNAFGNISSLEKKIAIEFLTIPKEERQKSIKKLTEKYFPQVSLIMTTADDDVNRVCKRLRGALVAINASSEIADEAKETYEKERKQKVEYYESILKSFGENICITEETTIKKEEGSGV